MPTAPPRQCVEPGCPDVAVMRGRCRTHAAGWYRQREQQRGTSTARGYGREWQRVRTKAMTRDGWLCVLCKAAGYITLATEVDHIVPVSVDPSRRYDVTNCRAVCHACHTDRHRQDGRASG